MQRLARLLTLSAIAIVFSSAAALAQTQTDSNEDSCATFKQADALLNKSYNQVLSEYRKNAAFIRKLRVAQRAWIAYRDAQIEALYPATDKRAEYGSVYPMCRCSALAALTTQRADELKKWVDGLEEGDVCSGSIKIRN
ncbi:MAG TPA: lysozyme inhibitor LprI family protein [Blastocatellia bacterium]|nr:lysozyme inhibitor LprI family protein [Blastocatellia bacterium]